MLADDDDAELKILHTSIHFECIYVYIDTFIAVRCLNLELAKYLKNKTREFCMSLGPANQVPVYH